VEPHANSADHYGSQNWGDVYNDAVTATAAGTFVSPMFPQLVNVQDVAQVWALRASIFATSGVTAGDTLTGEFHITGGTGRALFGQLLTIPMVGPLSAVELSTVVPVFPAQTIQIKVRAVLVAAGARVVPFRINVCAVPYYPGAR
jgi:hypothetical protein